ncbi:MAG: peroxiredoxin [Candidatus Poribacteria bacterium]
MYQIISLLYSSVDPRIGKPAPDFEALATNGKTIKLSDLKGSWVVLYFYPKSFTPGCTAEACALRDSYDKITDLGVVLPSDEGKKQELNVVILGVSTDSIETQNKFKTEYKLPFDLLSDKEKVISKAYNVLGLTGITAQRKTFIIDPEGKIVYIFDKVDAGKHDQEVMKALEELQS